MGLFTDVLCWSFSFPKYMHADYLTSFQYLSKGYVFKKAFLQQSNYSAVCFLLVYSQFSVSYLMIFFKKKNSIYHHIHTKNFIISLEWMKLHKVTDLCFFFTNVSQVPRTMPGIWYSIKYFMNKWMNKWRVSSKSKIPNSFEVFDIYKN